MATFEIIPKIKFRVEGMGLTTLANFCSLFNDEGQWLVRETTRCVVLFDVAVAERAASWLKEHGVTNFPPTPERDTAKAIGQCRRCGETDSRRKNGRCMGAPGSTHDWPECPSEYERCAKAMAVGAAQGTCKNSGMDCGAHEFRGVFADTNPAYPRKTPIGGIGPRVRGSK